MTEERWKALFEGDDIKGPHLTQEEIDQGWHFCPEFDGLLLNPNENDSPGFFKVCTCLKND